MELVHCADGAVMELVHCTDGTMMITPVVAEQDVNSSVDAVDAQDTQSSEPSPDYIHPCSSSVPLATRHAPDPDETATVPNASSSISVSQDVDLDALRHEDIVASAPTSSNRDLQLSDQFMAPEAEDELAILSLPKRRSSQKLRDSVREDFDAVDELLDAIAKKYRLSAEQVYRMLSEFFSFKTAHANPWHWQVIDCIIVFSGVTYGLLASHQRIFYPLQTRHLKTIAEESSKQTVHQRHKGFLRIAKQLKQLAEDAQRKFGFEVGAVVVGNNAHTDDRNQFVYETEFMDGVRVISSQVIARRLTSTSSFFVHSTKSSDVSEFLGHARAWTMFGLSKRTLNANFENVDDGDASGEPSHIPNLLQNDGNTVASCSGAVHVQLSVESAATGSQKVVTMQEVDELSEEQSLIFIRQQFEAAIARFSGIDLPPSKNIPWQTLPGKLVEWGLQLNNWPKDVRCPGETTANSKGISVLRLEERRALARAFVDPKQPITLEQLSEEERNRDDEWICILHGVAPPAGDEHEHGLRLLVKRSNHKKLRCDREGLSRLQSTSELLELPVTPPPGPSGTIMHHFVELTDSDSPTPRPVNRKKRRLVDAKANLVAKIPAESNTAAARKRARLMEKGVIPELASARPYKQRKVADELPHIPSISRQLLSSRRVADESLRASLSDCEPVVELPQRSRSSKRNAKGKEAAVARDLDVQESNIPTRPPADLIAPMIRGTTHRVKPRPVPKSRVTPADVLRGDSREVATSITQPEIQAEIFGLRPNDLYVFQNQAEASTVANAPYTQPRKEAPGPGQPLSSDQHSLPNQPSLPDQSSLPRQLTQTSQSPAPGSLPLSHQQPSQSMAAADRRQFTNPSFDPVQGHPAAHNVPFQSQYLSPFMQQYLQAQQMQHTQQGAGTSGGSTTQVPQSYQQFAPGFPVNAMNTAAPFGSLPSTTNASVQFNQPTAGPSNANATSSSALPAHSQAPGA
ncbi:hypothetical protein NM688_g8634 [Phlebia brevispora]|uniref:Uncharacterized protein n=1 Tax=Phlebia brevispora TaxID=194682 RepID=A0ACC1RRB3_9APHY|nr:hypothetical protein NM688_g8634 [Phlebia brevispora]